MGTVLVPKEDLGRGKVGGIEAASIVDIDVDDLLEEQILISGNLGKCPDLVELERASRALEEKLKSGAAKTMPIFFLLGTFFCLCSIAPLSPLIFLPTLWRH